MLHYTLAVSLKVVPCLPRVVSRPFDPRSPGCDSAKSRSCTACVWLSPKSSRQKHHYGTKMVFSASKSRISVNSPTSGLGSVRTPSGRARERMPKQSPMSFDWISRLGRIGLLARTREEGSRPRADAHSPIATRSTWNRRPCRPTTTPTAWKPHAHAQPSASAPSPLSSFLARISYCTPRRSCAHRHKSRFVTPLSVDHHPQSSSYINPKRPFDKAFSRVTRQHRPLLACPLKPETDLHRLATSREGLK